MILPPDWLAQLQAAYPKRYGPQGWIRVRTILPQSVSAGATWDEILSGTKAYRDYCDATGKTGTEHVKSAQTFYDYRVQGWTEDYAPPQKPPSAAEQRLNARWDQLRAQAQAQGFRPPTPVESADVYETAIRQAGRENPRPMAGIIDLLAQRKRV